MLRRIQECMDESAWVKETNLPCMVYERQLSLAYELVAVNLYGT